MARKSQRRNLGEQTDHPAAELRVLPIVLATGPERQQCHFLNPAILNSILPVAAAVRMMTKRLANALPAELEVPMVAMGVLLETTAQAGSRAADLEIAVFGAAAMHLSTAPAAEAVEAVIIRTGKDALAMAAPATRALSISASRWTRAFITDEEGSICDLQ